jgi:hypothetical protein
MYGLNRTLCYMHASQRRTSTLPPSTYCTQQSRWHTAPTAADACTAQIQWAALAQLDELGYSLRSSIILSIVLMSRAH